MGRPLPRGRPRRTSSGNHLLRRAARCMLRAIHESPPPLSRRAWRRSVGLRLSHWLSTLPPPDDWLARLRIVGRSTACELRLVARPPQGASTTRIGVLAEVVAWMPDVVLTRRGPQPALSHCLPRHSRDRFGHLGHQRRVSPPLASSMPSYSVDVPTYVRRLPTRPPTHVNPCVLSTPLRSGSGKLAARLTCIPAAHHPALARADLWTLGGHSPPPSTCRSRPALPNAIGLRLSTRFTTRRPSCPLRFRSRSPLRLLETACRLDRNFSDKRHLTGVCSKGCEPSAARFGVKLRWRGSGSGSRRRWLSLPAPRYAGDDSVIVLPSHKLARGSGIPTLAASNAVDGS